MQFPKTFAELINLSGNIDVVCSSRIDDLEDYPEADMKMTVSLDKSYLTSCGDVVKLAVSYQKFDEFNKQFESSNYYDKNGDPCLNARQAGLYKVEDFLYVTATDDPSDFFRTEDGVNPLYEEYMTTKTGDQTYVQWLEMKLTSLKG